MTPFCVLTPKRKQSFLTAETTGQPEWSPSVEDWENREVYMPSAGAGVRGQRPRELDGDQFFQLR